MHQMLGQKTTLAPAFVEAYRAFSTMTIDPC
jgi:hypothetical protein